MSLSNAQASHEFAQSLRFEGGTEAQTLLAYETSTRTFWLYARGVWRLQDEDSLHGMVRRWLMTKSVAKGVTMGTIRDVAEQLKFEVDRYDVLPDTWIAYEDGSLNPDTGEFAPHSPERFASIKAKALYRNPPRMEDAPLFSKFLDDVCQDADGKPLEGMKVLLQECFGFILLGSSDRHLSLFFTGVGRNGKSVLSGILQAIIGRERVSNLTLNELTGNRFSTSALAAKRLNISDEVNVHRRAASSTFKRLVSVETIQMERKFQDSYSHKPRVKFVFILNGFPIFDGFDYALRERILVVPFFRSFKEEERIFGLTEKIVSKELPAVIAWSLEGLQRLQANNLRFSVTDESRKALEKFESASKSLHRLLK